MNLKEISSGVYSKDGAPISKRNRLVVAVHPYFYMHYYFWDSPQNPSLWSNIASSDQRFIDISFAGYMKRFEKFLNRYGGPVVVHEEEKSVENTLARFSLIERKNIFFVYTQTESTELARVDFNTITGLYRSFPSPIALVGGCFPGCLSHTMEMFQKHGLSCYPIKPLTFSDIPWPSAL